MARKQALKRIRDVEVGLGDGQDRVWQRVLGEGEMNCDQLAKSCGRANFFKDNQDAATCPGIMDAFRWVESGLDGISLNGYGVLMSDILSHPFCYTKDD